ncbi:hypothetical protein NDU88_001856 [Pleurodeles waltl]|uniref:Uncharacterized protein n=1 Tax=Pleurodeles waltl TaxID=8319 RepID=A0AAV7WNJ8_PLEWA|nr:hypothetical protein NDU88_001856 [Pleurodeles waltl]
MESPQPSAKVQPGGTRKQEHPKVPAFLCKLEMLLDDPDTKEFISWNQYRRNDNVLQSPVFEEVFIQDSFARSR